MFRLIALLLLFSTPAMACSVNVDSSAHKPISYPMDEALFSKVFLDYINAYRCQAGLKPLHTSRLLSRESERHADWMADNVTVSHVGNVKGRETPSDRVAQTRIKNTMSAENVARIAHYSVDSVPSFHKRGPCLFERDGHILTQRTYAQAAAFMAAGYMKSEGHRRNILTPGFTTTGIGVRLDPSGDYCGQIYHAQLFSD